MSSVARAIEEKFEKNSGAIALGLLAFLVSIVLIWAGDGSLILNEKYFYERLFGYGVDYRSFFSNFLYYDDNCVAICISGAWYGVVMEFKYAVAFLILFPIGAGTFLGLLFYMLIWMIASKIENIKSR